MADFPISDLRFLRQTLSLYWVAPGPKGTGA